MRWQGRITEWKDDRGFGFITPNGGGDRVFLHVRAMRRGQGRPAGNELVTYELEPAAAGDRGPRSRDVAYVERAAVAPVATRRRPSAAPSAWRWLAGVIVVMLAAYAFQRLGSSTGPVRPAPATAATEPAAGPDVAPSRVITGFKCEGKKFCSQMTSCDEALFYLRNCPDVQIDGDGDGIPCERQFCRP